nr:hypothetical protein [Alicyclobacillus sacchari]
MKLRKRKSRPKNVASDRQTIGKRRTFRVRVVYGLVFLSFSSLILRMAYVQVAQGKTFRQSEMTTQYARVPILPQRGWIYDANGQVLAWDKPVLAIELDRYTPMTDAQMHQLAAILAPYWRRRQIHCIKLCKVNRVLCRSPWRRM